MTTTAATVRSEITIAEGFRSREVASFVSQLDDQLVRLRANTRELTPADLQWQPARGMNTIGMLLAHLAIVEVWWVKIGVQGEQDPDVRDVLGIGVDDDGLPIAAGAEPFPFLNGKDLAFYDDLLDRARKHTKRLMAAVSDESLEKEVLRVRKDGTKRVLNGRWIYYHVLEHFAGHYGQILLLMHLRGDAVKRA